MAYGDRLGACAMRLAASKHHRRLPSGEATHILTARQVKRFLQRAHLQSDRIVAVTEPWPNAYQLLAGYLHQDWTWDYQSPEDAVAHFAASATRDSIRAAQAELADVLQSLSDPDLDAWFDHTGCMYYPPADQLTTREWLERVNTQLQHALTGDLSWRPGPVSSTRPGDHREPSPSKPDPGNSAGSSRS